MISIIGKGKDARNLATMLNCKRFDKKADIFIRYGNIREGFEGIQINSIEAINNARDKLRTLMLLNDNNIRIPKYGLVFEDATNMTFFARNRYHKKGKDILIYKDDDVVPVEMLKHTKDYWIKYIPVNNEYRVHVMNDNVIQICKKIPNDNTHENDMIRNLEHGWHFAEARNWENGYTKLKEMAVATVKCLELDFGAVDIILGKDKKYYVLEVNTAPGLDNKRLELYVEYLLKLVILKSNPPNQRIRAKLILPEWFDKLVYDFGHYYNYKYNNTGRGIEFLRRFFKKTKEERHERLWNTPQTIYEEYTNNVQE